MDTLTRMLEATSAALGPFVARVMGALTIVLLAWLAARLVRAAALQAGTRRRVDERLHSPGLMVTLSGVASALVWLLALPALLDTLQLQGLLTPVNAMLSAMMGFVPNLFGALVVLAVGMLIANIVRQILSGVLRAAGSEKVTERLGLGTALGKAGLAGMAGNVAYVLLRLPTLVAALQPLGLDKLPQRLGAAPLSLAGRSLQEWGGLTVMVAVVMVAITQASEIQGLPVLTEMLSALGAVVGGIAIGLALAFGMGGRHLAGRVLDRVAAGFESPTSTRAAPDPSKAT